MFKKGSRYEKTRTFDATADGLTVFEGIRPREIGTATGVIEHVVKAGDRLDLLAGHYYNDDRLWWRIVDANPDFLYGGDMVLEKMEGQVILVPKARE
jgi:nucleoid-associated protein YgaU